ncbi:unnamed protein product [Candida verbasci]|uniref:Uncharacterized protein n=1 Tax=Candida verbasci TaxID=1227364 RepID=A0A9W4TPA7_9ASCO|nr:unnamed protein product [Candida verbasci]
MLFNILKSRSPAVLIRKLSQSSFSNNSKDSQKVMGCIAIYGFTALGIAQLAEKNDKGYIFKQLGGH